MTTSDWEMIKSVFARAIEIPAAERQDFVAAELAGRQDLIVEVTSLLDSADEPDNLIESNAFDLNSRLIGTKQNYTDKHFGKYRIISEIGHGGMGTVFLAERDDGEFSMKVALKIVRQSIADSQIIERFKRERQILAGLKHPNIAALYDGGVSEKGEPFLAMEYVEGKTLTVFARDNELNIRERLILFLKVCSAVDFAHRNLVVHQDIKPTNILITSDGEPKLLDFGLARSFEADSSATQTTLRAFTPAYASPEQILGKNLTTATDIYSLGVVLFELLSGKKPFEVEGLNYEKVVETLTKHDPSTPSSVAQNTYGKTPIRVLDGDLDNITLMAIRKEPERRYPSVSALADDIHSHLDGRPISARANTFGYLANRFIKRNKIAVAAAFLIAISVLAGLGIALWQANVARNERDRAEKRFQDVRQLSNSLLFEIAPKIERLQGSTEARELLVKRALTYLDSLASETRDDIALQLELADAYQKIGDLQGNPRKPNLSDFSGAIESYTKSQTILESLPQTTETRTKLAANFRELANIRFAQSEIKGSIADSESSLAIYETLLAENPTSLELAKSQLATAIDYGHTFSINNQYPIAIPIYRNALASANSLDRSEAEVLRLLTLGNSYLSNALSWDNQQSEAEIENENAIALAEELRAKYPNDSNIQQTVLTAFTLASGTFEGIKNDVSLKFAESALAVARRSSEIDPADTQARQNLARALSRYGNILLLNKRTAEGFESLRAAEKIVNELIAREPRNRVYQDDLGTLFTRFGDAEENRNDLAAALANYKRSADIFGELAATDETNTVAQRDWAQAIKSVGVIQIKLGQTADARTSLTQAIAIVNRLKKQNALGKWDEKTFAEMETLLAKLN